MCLISHGSFHQQTCNVLTVIQIFHYYSFNICSAGITFIPKITFFICVCIMLMECSETRKSSWISWNRNYRGLWASIWVSGTEPCVLCKSNKCSYSQSHLLASYLLLFCFLLHWFPLLFLLFVTICSFLGFNSLWRYEHYKIVGFLLKTAYRYILFNYSFIFNMYFKIFSNYFESLFFNKGYI